MSKEVTTYDAGEFLPRKENPYQLNTTLKPVPLKSITERIDPQGEAVQAAYLIGKTFTILEAKPFNSAYDVGREVVYWVKAVDADGILFNTVLGGRVICEALDAIVSLNAEYRKAVQTGDEARAEALLNEGAGAPVSVTLTRHDLSGGQFYYSFE